MTLPAVSLAAERRRFLAGVVRPRLILAVVALSSMLAACGGRQSLLPHSVYYRAGAGPNAQVWRLDPDGLTTTQLTGEAAGVSSYSVSRADGSLAFVSDNRLFVVDGVGENRRLIADGNLGDRGYEDAVFRSSVDTPVFSPDGSTLAYAFDGLHLFDLGAGQDRHLLKNLGNLNGEPFVFEREAYAPGSWSPDGSKLLIIMGYFEGSTLAVVDLGEADPFRRLRSDGPVCCTYHWTPDGESVLAANPSFGVVWPGLWRYDVATGQGSELVASSAASFRFAGWPLQLPSGDLLFFYGDRFSPEAGIPLVLARSDSEGEGRVQIRPEEFRIAEALWAEDGSLALVLRVSEAEGRQLVLVRPDDSPVKVLLQGESISDLTWGP